MKHAIAQLEILLDVLTTNEPISRAEGNTAQADLQAVTALEISHALVILKAVSGCQENEKQSHD